MRELFYDLLRTPSASGFEQPLQRIVRERMKPFADSVESDLHGNVIIAVNPKAKRRIMLAGHCDQIGLMVKHISKDGFLYVSALGGIDAGVLPGSQVVVHGARGAVAGVIGRKPIHHQVGEEREKMKLDIDKVWIDIGAKNQREAERKVMIGDAITFRLEVLELGKDLIVSPGIDDKAGLYVALEALRLCSQEKKLKVGVFAVSTVQEEMGLRGARTAAFGIDPEVGIAIDVTFSSDNPGSDNPRATPVALGKGPVLVRGPNINPIAEGLLFQAAKKAKISHQVLPSARPLGNDANAIQISRAGVAASSIGIPCRYMHTQAEICSFKDLQNSARLLQRFIAMIDERTDFRPS